MINASLNEVNTSSNDLLVSEEILEIGDLKVCGGKHDNNRDGSEGYNSTLDQCVLCLQGFFVENQNAELVSYLFNHVLNLLCLELNWSQVLLSHNI